jgi:hypothetical protein
VMILENDIVKLFLHFFVPWRIFTDPCGVNQTYEDAFKSRQNRISIRSWKIIENIQLLHECKKITMNICFKLLLKLQLIMLQSIY